MREWGVDIRLFSTRPPDQESAAQHGFAKQAREETRYLWPRPVTAILAAVAWAGLMRPRQFARAGTIPFSVDSMSLRQRAATFPLLPAACVLAREAASLKICHLHLHSAARSAVIAMMTHRLIGTPYSLSLNANLEWWGGAMRSKLGDAAFTITHAEWLRDQILCDYPSLNSSRILLARVGVDTRKWVPGERREGDSVFRLATVSRLHYGKGHDVLFNAVARLRDSGETSASCHRSRA